MKKYMMPAIAFDFDGVIHTYENGWQDGSIYGRLNQQVLEAIYGFHEKGYPVFVFSTRNPQQIVVWLNEHLTDLKAKAISEDTIFFNDTNYIGVTRYKIPAMAYIDDRAYHYCGQSGETLVNDILKAETRPKGEWIGKYDNLSQSFYWVCNKCNYKQSWGRFKYCPTCGTDMRGGD